MYVLKEIEICLEYFFKIFITGFYIEIQFEFIKVLECTNFEKLRINVVKTRIIFIQLKNHKINFLFCVK